MRLVEKEEKIVLTRKREGKGKNRGKQNSVVSEDNFFPGRGEREGWGVEIILLHRETKTAGFIRCDYLVVTYCSFPFIFVFDGRTDRRTDILMSFLNCR